MSSLRAPVKTAMSQPVTEFDGTRPVADAAKLLLSGDIGSIVVTTPDRGIVTKTDLVSGITDDVFDPTQPVREVMTSEPITIDETASIGDAVRTMDDHDVKRLPVVDSAGSIIGIVTTSDLLTVLADDSESALGGLATALSALETAPPHRYECPECDQQTSSETRPSACPDCGATMHNISVPRE